MHKYKPLLPYKKTLTKKALSASLLACSLAGSPLYASDIDKTIENALKFGQEDGKYGQVKFNLRYRYEYADTDNTGPQPAHANTFRLRLGYLTPEFHGLQAYAEYETVYAAQNDYNGVVYGDKGHHIVADPADRHELNQLWISYKGIPDTTIKGGRQRIKLDDDRFIGNVGWRQMEQTYDSAVVINKSIPNLTATAGYIGRVKDIFSRTDPTEAPFLNLNYKLGEYGEAVVYGYWLDFTEKGSAGKSNQTYGIRFNGSPKLNDDVKLHYTAEYSFQSDYENNPVDYDAHRYHVMLGATAFGITGKAAVEQLGGDGRKAFITPLGTNHAFQGWADRFLVTPATGLRDIHFTLSGKVLGTKLMFVYHNFQDDNGNIDYGNEYDFLIVKKFGKHYKLLAKYAYYDGDSSAPGAFKNDTQKAWVEGSISF